MQHFLRHDPAVPRRCLRTFSALSVTLGNNCWGDGSVQLHVATKEDPAFSIKGARPNVFRSEMSRQARAYEGDNKLAHPVRYWISSEHLIR